MWFEIGHLQGVNVITLNSGYKFTYLRDFMNSLEFNHLPANVENMVSSE